MSDPVPSGNRRVTDEVDVLALAVSRLDAAGIEYMITGSFALTVYATPRMTRDIDVVIDCSVEQAVALAESFQGDSYASIDAARAAVVSRTMFNVVHNETLYKLDFIMRGSDSYTDQQFARRRRIGVDGIQGWFIAPEDLVLAKLLWRRQTGSEQQLRDVRSVLDTAPGLDHDYLTSWAARLGLSDVLRDLFPHA